MSSAVKVDGLVNSHIWGLRYVFIEILYLKHQVPLNFPVARCEAVYRDEAYGGRWMNWRGGKRKKRKTAGGVTRI